MTMNMKLLKRQKHLRKNKYKINYVNKNVEIDYYNDDILSMLMTLIFNMNDYYYVHIRKKDLKNPKKIKS